ncbi:MAG TPA: sugar phosphate isomerase/epimerase family protein [Blastocatellia bacterium]|nr:sugar phosphate isomerase/epimerase family protein [Blastocatellia bacterium]HMV87252.1 sugar phosphate isomerase/epimerase family protein [Blastocatellia bacterium]HMX29486.1 sugar phosphate isomerase/epimerase family protein [Blastocatellia bacterium]HMY74755.1 sugar phosphate isomerase/epimerase family protein [Blastocatellia bacterium]HMZ21010.1 sugar phosphate isomerase/epimerase family protein [Blastocatellia bacterium]
MIQVIDRRDFIKQSMQVAAQTAAVAGVAAIAGETLPAAPKQVFKISLAQWSLHRALFKKELDHLDFIKVAKQQYGISAVEYVNQFFKDKAKDSAYLAEMNKRAKDLGVEQRLIMCDGEGALGDPDEAKRKQAVENHYKWVEAAKTLGCKIIRVNAQSRGSYEEQQKLAADGLHKLAEFGAKHKIAVIVENHGGLSSNGQWLTGVMKLVNHPNCGTLPDFGNFRVSANEEYDRYKGVTEMMSYAKAVSAKTHDFDERGEEIHTDYHRMMKIVLDAGYRSFVGIEYEGEKMSEPDGIRASKKLLERVHDELSKKVK